MHSFFTGGGSPSPASTSQPGGAPAAERRSLATYDPQAQARSPQPTPSPLPSNPSHQLSSNSAAFAPRQQPPPTFIPQAQQQQQQQQQQYGTSPSPQYAHLPGSSPYQSQSPYLQHGAGKTPSQNIPNGNPYGGPGGPGSSTSGGPGSRNGSYVGSPVMGGAPPQGRPANRQSFGGPTSPRMQNVSLPQGQPMMYPQQWPGQVSFEFVGGNPVVRRIEN